MSEKAKKLMKKIKITDGWLHIAQLVCRKTDAKTKYDINNFTFPWKFTSKIYHCDLTLHEAEDDQQKLQILIDKLNNDYDPECQTKIKEKDDALKSAKKLFFIKEDIIRAFKKGIFPYIDGFQVQKKSDEESDEKSAWEWRNRYYRHAWFRKWRICSRKKKSTRTRIKSFNTKPNA